jgi:hypothetical protein
MNWAETASLDVNTFHVANVTDLKRDQAQRALRRILADAAPRCMLTSTNWLDVKGAKICAVGDP